MPFSATSFFTHFPPSGPLRFSPKTPPNSSRINRSATYPSSGPIFPSTPNTLQSTAYRQMTTKPGSPPPLPRIRTSPAHPSHTRYSRRESVAPSISNSSRPSNSSGAAGPEHCLTLHLMLRSPPPALPCTSSTAFVRPASSPASPARASASPAKNPSSVR
jgi:hypothetical protein